MRTLNRTYILASTGTEGSGSLNSQLVPLMGPKFKKPTVAERCLPWRRDRNGRPISLYKNHNFVRIEPSYQVFACVLQQISSPTSPATRCLL